MDSYQKDEKFRELCYIGDMELIRNFMRSNNPDLNSQNKVNGWTCLHWACSRNNLDLIQYLCESGASQQIKNKDNKTPFECIKDKNIQRCLGLNFDDDENQETAQKSSIVPNFIKNPQFHYIDKSLYESETIKQNSEIDAKTMLNDYQLLDSPKTSKTSKEIITLRVRSNFDDDFIEIDIDKQNLDFEMFKRICRLELEGVNDNYKILKIRKLPNILIRNTNDIKRLKNEQEIEFIFDA